jgi:hypothetical protein
MQAWLSLTSPDSDLSNKFRYGGELPEIPLDLCHLIPMMMEIGIADQQYSQLTVLTWKEMEAWSKMTSITLTPFEAQAIHAMSQSYVSIANNPECECPINFEVVRNQKDKESIASWASYASKPND